MPIEKNISKESAFKFVILIGVVSLFADMTYEGARSITGQMGILYDISIPVLVVFSVIIQLLAVPIMFIVMRKVKTIH